MLELVVMVVAAKDGIGVISLFLAAASLARTLARRAAQFVPPGPVVTGAAFGVMSDGAVSAVVTAGIIGAISDGGVDAVVRLGGPCAADKG